MTEPCLPTSLSQQPTRVAIIGGGLAGVAAAVQLAEQGLAVTLVETRKRLGGRAGSFVDPANGQTLDNCQHVLMGCCTNLIDLYHKLGVHDAIQWHRKLFFTGPAAVNALLANRADTERPWIVDQLEADDLPAPMHMTAALMRFRTLSWTEKVAVSRGMLAIMRLGKDGRKQWRDVSFLDWLDEHHQPTGAVEKFWSVIIISALNELPARVSAAYAMQVFQEGFLANENAYVMGLSTVPLGRLYDPAKQVIEQAGGQVLLGSGAEQFVYEPGDFEHHPTPGVSRAAAMQLSDGSLLHADQFISAVPFDRLEKLCSPEMAKHDERLRRLDRLTVSPIIGIHLWFDAPAPPPPESGGKPCSGEAFMAQPHLILTQSPLQWLFNKGVSREGQWRGHHLHGVVSAAHDLVDWPAERIIDLALAEVRKAVPASRCATLLHARVVKEKRATFSIKPGVDRLRPTAMGAIENLYLAGDWCDTGWPATMEGAVRSGYLAARAVLNRIGCEAPALAADLADAPLYQFVAG